MDQRLVVGVGNIYASESLFRARLAPARAAGSLGPREARRLARSVRQVLLEAIEAGGSSLRDYVQSNGELGNFQRNFRVYDRAGEPCRSAADRSSGSSRARGRPSSVAAASADATADARWTTPRPLVFNLRAPRVPHAIGRDRYAAESGGVASMAYETILVERRGAVGLITLNRPKALNALNAQLIAEIEAALSEFDARRRDRGHGADRLGEGLRRRRRHQGDGRQGLHGGARHATSSPPGRRSPSTASR